MSPGSKLSPVEERTFAFAEDVVKLAHAIAGAGIAKFDFEGKRDPKAYGLALLCRSISNFRGALTMARHDQVVECRTLVRSCWENLFLVDGLLREGAAFVETMRSHESWGRVSLGETSLKHPGVADTPSGQIVRGLIKRERAEFPKPNKMSVKSTAKGDIEKMYPAYAVLSHDAAHASVTALRRYFRRRHDGRLTMDIVPPFKAKDRLATLDMACEAVLGACIGVSQLLGGTPQNDVLRALWEQFVHQDRHASTRDGAT